MNAAQSEKSKGNTVNILIDVSGSMKQNDPDNRRISAVKLLINLLPDSTKSGIWLFAEKTERLIKTAEVNSHWKKKALVAVNSIHSRGVYTDIEDAIQATLKDGFVKSGNNHLILLTDGMVDTSQDIIRSAESRERIMADLIPLLQQRQIKVHTIELSDHADTELLEKLAIDTSGWFESSRSSEQLQKTFLKLFNKSLPQDRVPLNNNTFSIDASIKEFSILVFKNAGAPRAELIGPDKSKFSSKTRAQNLRWIEGVHYDLITMQQPVAGEWRIDTEVDPDNQVMVMTDLKFSINDLPDYIAEQETIKIKVNFSEQGELITRRDFLELIDISLQQTDDLKRKSTWKMQADPDEIGYFSQMIGETLGKGRHLLKIVADGKTFQREIMRTIEVVATAVNIKKTFDPESQMITLEMLPDHKIIDADMMTISAIVKRPGKDEETYEIKPREGRLLLSLKKPEQAEKIIVNFSMMAKTLRGEPITPNIQPVIIDKQFMTQNQNAPKLKSNSEVESDSQETELKNRFVQDSVADGLKDDSEKNQVNEEETEERYVENSGSWGMVITAVIFINILLIVSGFFGYKYIKKRTREKQEQLLERLT